MLGTSGPDSASCDVVFFYFDKQSKDASQVSSALRALLAQLLHIHGGSENGIDIASLLWYQGCHGQQLASDTDIKDILTLICGHTDRLVLFVDGTDECSDPKDLFTSLERVGFATQDHSIAVFGRPTVPLPKRISGGALHMTLETEHNLTDIRRYVRHHVNQMVDDDILPEDVDVDKTIEMISRRANGMFLWATLLLSYINLTHGAMTVSQIHDTIENLNRLEGLDTLYGAIIDALSRTYTGKARANIHHLFQWVVCSPQPLFVSELGCALATPLDRKLESGDDFRDLSRSLSRMSGALLEIHRDRSVRFIHLSSLEYFQASAVVISGSEAFGPARSSVSFSGTDAHIYVCMACFSYIYYTVGAQPLSGSTHTSLDQTALTTKYPFLDHASKFLFYYLLKAIDLLETELKDAGKGQLSPLLDLIKQFLSSKKTITTWIEACWTYRRRPQVDMREVQVDKMLAFSRLALDRGSHEFFERCIKHLSRLEYDLMQLNEKWGKVLLQTPNEIWEPSISAFIQSDFWSRIQGSRLIPIDSGDSGSSFVCINSRTSADGTEIGIIKVQPPLPETASSTSLKESIWFVQYEIWSLESTRKFCTSFHIPDSMVPFSYIWERKKDSTDDKPILEFLFPTTISSDLRHATFLNLVGSIVGEDCITASETDATFSTREPDMLFQVIDVSLRTDPAVCGSFSLDWASYHPGFWTCMSDSGEYLLVMHLLPANEKKQINRGADAPTAKTWFVRVYRNEDFGRQGGPRFRLLSAIAFIPDQITEPKQRPFTFHPTLPLLIFASGRTAWMERPDQEMGISILNISKPNVEGKSTGYQPFALAPMGALTLIWNFAKKGTVTESLRSYECDQ